MCEILIPTQHYGLLQKNSTSLSHHKVSYSRRKPSFSLLSYSHPICLDTFNASISESMSGNVSKWMTSNFWQRALWEGSHAGIRWKFWTVFRNLSSQGVQLSQGQLFLFTSPHPTHFSSASIILSSLTDKVWLTWQGFRNQNGEPPPCLLPEWNKHLFQF